MAKKIAKRLTKKEQVRRVYYGKRKTVVRRQQNKTPLVTAGALDRAAEATDLASVTLQLAAEKARRVEVETRLDDVRTILTHVQGCLVDALRTLGELGQ